MQGLYEVDHRESPATLVRIAPPFVGRKQELAWLEHSLQEMAGGQPRVMLIAGEAGIGKTRLLQEVRLMAVRHGAQVGYGRCYEDLALPYLPFVEALHPLLEHIREDTGRTLGLDADVLGQLFRQARLPSAGAGPSMAVQADQDKLRLLLAVSGTIIKLAQGCPTLFIVDDLHWADQPSLELFGYLAFTLAEAAMRGQVPLLIFGAYRPVEPEERLSRLIARLQREAICQTFTLSGLSEPEIQSLIQGLGHSRPSHQLTATVSGATQGNPLFVQEVLHHLVQQDALRERGGYLVATASPSDLRLPEHVTGAIVARIRSLSEGSQRVLTLASCVGEIFSLPTLATVSGVSEAELLDLLEEGMRQRLLRSEGQVFQFAHPLIRHVFYHEASAARRQRIHCQIAQALEHLYADSLDAHLLEIAPHLLRAGPTAQAEDVMNYARRAGDQAFSVSAWREAAHYYEGALSAAGSCGRLSLHDRAEMHYRAGLAYYRDQDVGPCLDHHNKAIEAYRLAGDMRGLAQALMEKTHIPYRTSPYGTRVDVQALENVLQALGEDEPGLRGNIAAAISQAYRYGRQPAKAKEMAQRAVEIGQRLKDDRLCAEASFALGMAQAQTLHVRETLESWQNAVAHARRADDLWLQGQPLTRLPHILTSLGRLDEAQAIAHEAGELICTTQDWGNYSLTLSTLVCLAVARGDFATAERRTHETMLMMSRSRYPWGGSRALFAQACARALCGAWAEAEDILDLLVEPGRVFEDSGPIIQAFVGVFRRLLRMQVAGEVDTLEPFALNLLQGNEMDSYALAPLCALVELGNLMHAPVMAEQPYKALTLAAERGVLFSNANGWMFLIPRVLGVAATLQQQWDTAATHFQTAIDAATRIGARPELGRTYLDYARTLISRGKREDHRQAGELVRQASHIFDTLQMAPFARQAAQLAQALQMHIPSSSQPGAAYPDRLSKQEVDVLVLIAHGRSNREIGDNLLLSPRTVAPHVRNIFNKIGVRSRTAATAYTIEQGLVAQLPRRTKP